MLGWILFAIVLVIVIGVLYFSIREMIYEYKWAQKMDDDARKMNKALRDGTDIVYPYYQPKSYNEPARPFEKTSDDLLSTVIAVDLLDELISPTSVPDEVVNTGGGDFGGGGSTATWGDSSTTTYDNPTYDSSTSDSGGSDGGGSDGGGGGGD